MSRAARRAAWPFVLHGAALLVIAAGAAGEFTRAVAPTPLQVDPLAAFDAGFVARARAYHDVRSLVALGVLAVPLLVAGWWALSRRGRGLTQRVERRFGLHRPLRTAAVSAVAVLVAVELAVLPLVWWTGFVQDGAYGFRTQGFGGWLRDWFIARAPIWLGAAVGVPVAVAVARRLPRTWPAVLGLAAAVASALVTLGAPLVLEPLWLRTRPMPDGPDRAAVERVVEAAAAPATRILVGDESRRSTRANAYVSGLGATRRVVLFDTLLAQADPREVGLVVAHEFAHERHRDVGRGVLLAGAGGVLAAYALAAVLRAATASGAVRGADDPRAVVLALFALLVLSTAALPVQSALSRRAEAAADWTALDLTRDPAGFAAMQRTLARSHLSDPVPPAWARLLWYSHPPVTERLGLAARWAQEHPGGSP